jgi:hypothetical protein
MISDFQLPIANCRLPILFLPSGVFILFTRQRIGEDRELAIGNWQSAMEESPIGNRKC